jgi:hypothetical protein
MALARPGPALFGPDLAGPGPGPAKVGPDLEGQGQGQQNWLRAGPDWTVDSLTTTIGDDEQRTTRAQALKIHLPSPVCFLLFSSFFFPLIIFFKL